MNPISVVDIVGGMVPDVPSSSHFINLSRWTACERHFIFIAPGILNIFDAFNG